MQRYGDPPAVLVQEDVVTSVDPIHGETELAKGCDRSAGGHPPCLSAGRHGWPQPPYGTMLARARRVLSSRFTHSDRSKASSMRSRGNLLEARAW